MPETVMMNQVRPTQPNPSMPSQQVQPGGWNTAPQQQQQPGQYSMQPKKSSKTWMWVVGILGLVVLICGGGGIGLLIFVGSQAEIESNTATNRSNTSTNQGRKSTTTPSSSPSTDPGPTSDRSTVEKVDLSEWVRPFSAFGTTEMSGSDFVMAAKQKGYYYVLAAPKDTAQTEQANTSVTLKNVDNADSRLGYGIVFHSNPTPLQQGYAFLIDSKKKKYRIVHHSPGKEDEVVKWVAEGYAVFIPHLNVLWEKHHPKTFEEWLSHDLEWVAACDAVLRLSGESKGADLEVEFCRVRGIPVFSSIADLIASVPKTQPVPQPPAIISHGREM